MTRGLGIRSGLVGLVALGLCVACAKNLPPPPPDPAPGARSEYIIGAGDVLRINVWQNSELSVASVPVRPDGKISIPLVDDVQAEGLTAHELKEVLSTSLSEFVSNPDVTVVVTGVNSKRAFTIGPGVQRNGAVNLSADLRVLEAIAVQGGFTAFADKKNVRLIRRTENGDVEYGFDYEAYVRGKAPGSNMLLQPGDTIIVSD